MINIDHLPKVGGAENIWCHVFILIDVVNFLWCVYLGFFFSFKALGRNHSAAINSYWCHKLDPGRASPEKVKNSSIRRQQQGAK